MNRSLVAALALSASTASLLLVAVACNVSSRSGPAANSGTNNASANNTPGNNANNDGPHPTGECAEACGPSELCSGVTNACEPLSCLPDRLEPDDSPEAATPIDASTTLRNLTICSQKHDFFTFTLEPGQDAEITATYPRNEDVDVDLLLYKNGALDIGARSNDPEMERIRLPRAATRTTYTLEVAIFPEQAAAQTYTLDLQIDPQGDVCTSSNDCDNARPCLDTGRCEIPQGCDDPNEPNDSDVTAKPLTGLLTGTICDGSDLDFFSFEVENQDDQIYITVEFDHADGDLDAAVYSPSGILAANSISVNDNEYITVRSSSGLRTGTWTLEVYGGTSTLSVPYTVDIDRNPPFAVCSQDSECPEAEYCSGRRLCLTQNSCDVRQDCKLDTLPACDQGTCTCTDDAEPNNTQATAATAAALEPDALLSTCGEDEDWFAIPVRAGQRVVATVNFDSILDDIDGALYDHAGAAVDEAVSGTAPEILEGTATQDGTWTLKLHSARPNRGTLYALDVQVTGP